MHTLVHPERFHEIPGPLVLAAGFFDGNTYTTVGYGAFVLPAGWEMLAPIIAMSGLFVWRKR